MKGFDICVFSLFSLGGEEKKTDIAHLHLKLFIFKLSS